MYLGRTPVVVLKQTGSAATSTLATSVAYAYADHLDTVRVIARSSDHAIVWRWDTAEVFGNTPASENPNGLGVYRFNQRFPGQVFDQETGNFQNVNRDYKPGIGRYAQSDPIGQAGGINGYAYVTNNPLSLVDLNGLAPGPATFWMRGRPSPTSAESLLFAMAMASRPKDMTRLEERQWDRHCTGPGDIHVLRSRLRPRKPLPMQLQR